MNIGFITCVLQGALGTLQPAGSAATFTAPA